ncbi:MAG: TIGR00282 family metallophosphoesterase [Planctomycetes bacterium]|nr:TIGR00282 family metallophosphoesterase [Planctomycetota bacterium]
MKLQILAIGDVVGKPGRELVKRRLPEFCRREHIDFVVANGENLSDGAGIMPAEADDLFAAGAHVVTGGDHVWNRKEIIPYIAQKPTLLRPANYPEEQPGRGATVVELPIGIKVAVVHLLGRVFMNTPAACPFRTAKQLVDKLRDEARVIVVDMHCEATSEKIAMGWWLDGQVSFVFGTHTHIQTADERVLPKGTAYITDCGMTGPYESVIGRRTDRVLHRFTTGMPARFEVATGDVRLCGAIATVDSATGLAESVRRVVLRADDAP